MYIKREYQGQGLGKKMLQLLLAKGKEHSFSAIYLETGSFMTTARHLYRSAGFHNREVYPEIEVPPELRHVWLFMKKRL
jgi:ribosomal protein S18 acetylase RimI-like enzyme